LASDNDPPSRHPQQEICRHAGCAWHEGPVPAPPDNAPVPHSREPPTVRNVLIATLLIGVVLMSLPLVAGAKQDALPKEPAENLALPDHTGQQRPVAPQPASPVTGSRGQLLYENHCQECHTSVVHVRQDHRVRSREGLAHWVSHWAGELKLNWNADDINDVVDYLSERYYQLK